MRVPPFEKLIREYDQRWLVNAADKTRRHQRTVLGQARAALPPFPSDVDVRKWLEGKIASGAIVGTTANAYLGVLGRLYSTAGASHGLPNPIRAIDAFPEAPAIRRAIPGDAPGGRLARVERMMALACRDDVERALIWTLYDLGLRIEEAIGLRPGDLDEAAGTVHVQVQRDPHAEAAAARLKTKGSRAKVNPSAEGWEWIRRALRDPARGRWGGRWRGAVKRDRLVAAFVFPFTQRGLDNLLRRLRVVDPEAFPRRNAWHVFRHSLASDMDEVRDAEGRRVYDLRDIGDRLRHSHGEWTRDYVESIRGRECLTDTDPLRAHRAAQRATMHAAEGVRGLGNVSGITAGNTHNDRGVAGGRVERLESLKCKGQRRVGSWWGSTHDTHNGNIQHDPVSPPPSGRQRSLPLGPTGTVPPLRSSKRKAGRS